MLSTGPKSTQEVRDSLQLNQRSQVPGIWAVLDQLGMVECVSRKTGTYAITELGRSYLNDFDNLNPTS
jgi:predicted transcriptional regulator